MKKHFQRISAFLLALVSFVSLNHKKVKAEESDINNNILSVADNDTSNLNEENDLYEREFNKSIIDKNIRAIENYYKETNISRNCILLINYPYLKSLGYKFPINFNTNGLDAIPSIKNSKKGWNTINLSLIFNNSSEITDKVESEDWRILEKQYLNNFVSELEHTEVIKYSRLLLEDNERNDAEEIEDLCYSIYQEYYESNNNTNSIKLNRLLVKLINKISDEDLYKDRSNGFYIVISEILGQFRSLFTLVDVKYIELGSTIASITQNCKKSFLDLTTVIIINENIYDENFGLYYYHPYDEDFKLNENKCNKIISRYTGKSIIDNKIDKIIFDTNRIKRYYDNKVNTTMKLTGYYNRDISLLNSNFLETLNYDYIKEDNSTYFNDFDSVYEDLAKLYRINIKIMNNYYNPISYNYNGDFIGNSSLILPYADLVLSKDDYKKCKEIETIYYNIINNYNSGIKVTYENEPYTNNIYMTDFTYYNELENYLDNILLLLENIKNSKHTIALDITIGIISKQMNDYIEGIILKENNYNISNKFNILKKIDLINNRVNKLSKNHLSRIMEKVEEQKQEEEKGYALTKIKNYHY